MHSISKETVKKNMPAVDVQHLLHLLIFTSTTDIENSTIPCQGQRNHYTCKKTTNAWYLNFWQQGNGNKCTDFLHLTWYGCWESDRTFRKGNRLDWQGNGRENGLYMLYTFSENGLYMLYTFFEKVIGMRMAWIGGREMICPICHRTGRFFHWCSPGPD